jgi:hypothetical protein
MAVVKLVDLRPRHLSDDALGCSPWATDQPRLWHEIAFLCPKCRKHEISVAFWAGEHRDAVQVGEAEYGPVIKRMWHREGSRGFLDLTLTPSINREGKGDKCGGWHGHIQDGEVRP